MRNFILTAISVLFLLKQVKILYIYLLRWDHHLLANLKKTQNSLNFLSVAPTRFLHLFLCNNDFYAQEAMFHTRAIYVTHGLGLLLRIR